MLWLQRLSHRLIPRKHTEFVRFYSSLLMQRVQIPEKMEIHLTDAENEICTLLDGCTKWMKDQHGMETSCRIAGGWVRDKVNTYTSRGLRTFWRITFVTI